MPTRLAGLSDGSLCCEIPAFTVISATGSRGARFSAASVFARSDFAYLIAGL